MNHSDKNQIILAFLGIIALALTAVGFALLFGADDVYGNEDRYCVDYHGEYDWDSTDHKSGSQSEKEFDKMIEHNTVCEISKAIDHEDVEGEIKSHEWNEFKDSAVWITADDDIRDCFEDRFDLPNDGKKHLAAYEIEECAWGGYEDD